MIRSEIIIFWSNEDQAFIAEVPELPGCMADGPTYQEALRNVELVTSEWLETARAGVSHTRAQGKIDLRIESGKAPVSGSYSGRRWT
jgi:predicted RNase H-like HicB family nuclease